MLIEQEDVKPRPQGGGLLPMKRRSSGLGKSNPSSSPSKRTVVPRHSSTSGKSKTPRRSATQRPACEVVPLSGKTIPSLNGLFTRVVNARSDGSAQMYIFGGTCELSDDTSILTNDFFRLDLETLVWQNLSGMLVEVINSQDPFARELIAQDLPELEHCTSALYYPSTGDRTYMLIFGGTDGRGHSTNGLISINLDVEAEEPLTWERVETSDEDGCSDVDVKPRSGAAIAVIGDRLFVFGGWSKTSSNRPKPCETFSILDLKSRRWIVLDQPYPSHVGNLGERIGVFAPDIYQGHKLLLVKGKMDDAEIKFKDDCMFLFNTETYSFVEQPHAGEPPVPMTWYDLSVHRSSDRICVVYGSINRVDKTTGELPSELWTFDVLSDRWKCEEMQKELWDLDMDLQTLEHVPGKGWYLFGYRQPSSPAAPVRAGASADYTSCWNVCVKLGLQNDA